jgi:branched-chain amino acid transport system permease protein
MTYNDSRWSWPREALGFAAAALLLAAMPLIVQDSYSRHILIMIFIYGLVAASWDLSLGYAGIFNFGHLALFGIGLYAYGTLTTVAHLNPWLAFLAGGLASALAAILVSAPILRLKGIYIVLVTFGFSQLAMTIIISQSWATGGTLGMVRIPTLPLFGHNLIRDGKLGYYYIALALLGLGTAALRVFVRSRLGLSVVALRENEDYAVSRGISLARQRVLTLAVSALATGFAGAFYGAYLRTASVEVFGMGMTTLILSMVLLGGAGTIYGSVLAAALLTILSETAANLGPWRPMLIAVLIVAVVLVYPTGLMGFLRSALRRWSGPERRAADVPAVPPSAIEQSPS